jgi:hypothetical protein
MAHKFNVGQIVEKSFGAKAAFVARLMGMLPHPPRLHLFLHRFVNGALAAEFALISGSAEKLIKRKREDQGD